MDDVQEFERYMAHLSGGLDHADRHAGLRGYCMGLMAPLKRQSVEPMASHLAPENTRGRPAYPNQRGSLPSQPWRWRRSST